ncbi:HPr family phosphocarrier protein [Paenibacillus eucommiae]|uniref:Phosphotransferase system HPr-like phosphotransfer protein n=1 Tax=Paenibacillus eucommiae TaxID=1355755 RepID=A0ABS4J8B4_9BACL|nr:HPr family phosphocarrier protein [Paenibacillus eucommiae]MBP1996084.1 phosphotransferase system HPr-like phosphotransfer protein [Paenibacillus eucommiae]
MMRLIKVKNIKDVETINHIVSQYSFDIWIHGKSGMVDAKSILGIFALKLSEPLTLVVPDDANYTPLFKELEEFIVFG